MKKALLWIFAGALAVVLFYVVYIFAGGAMEAHERTIIRLPVFALGRQLNSVYLSEGKKLKKFGRLPLGIYKGTVVFESVESAVGYRDKNKLDVQEWRIYQLTGDFSMDTYFIDPEYRLNKTLFILKETQP